MKRVSLPHFSCTVIQNITYVVASDLPFATLIRNSFWQWRLDLFWHVELVETKIRQTTKFCKILVSKELRQIWANEHVGRLECYLEAKTLCSKVSD